MTAPSSSVTAAASVSTGGGCMLCMLRVPWHVSCRRCRRACPSREVRGMASQSEQPPRPPAAACHSTTRGHTLPATPIATRTRWANDRQRLTCCKQTVHVWELYCRTGSLTVPGSHMGVGPTVVLLLYSIYCHDPSLARLATCGLCNLLLLTAMVATSVLGSRSNICVC